MYTSNESDIDDDEHHPSKQTLIFASLIVLHIFIHRSSMTLHIANLFIAITCHMFKACSLFYNVELTDSLPNEKQDFRVKQPVYLYKIRGQDMSSEHKKAGVPCE